MINYHKYISPIGPLHLYEESNFLTKISFKKLNDEHDKIQLNNSDFLKNVCIQLNQYFKGSRKEFQIPLKINGTNFQKTVWKQLVKVEYGKTSTYKEIAQNSGSPKAYRAVGSANNKNPIPIIIPCHRIIGSSGKLVGYAGGLSLKQKLLKIEKI